MKAEISYGKYQIGLYRTHASPLSGLKPIPESAFVGRSNTLFAVQVNVEVFGDNFMPAYTHGDNSNVVATDTMKNFVLRQGLEFRGSTVEGFAYFLGARFLATYPQMKRLRIEAVEQPFDNVSVPAGNGGGFVSSGVLFSKSANSRAFGVVEVERDGDTGVSLLDHLAGINGLQLMKITGSSFASFARDEYTTLPERVDRPLFIYLDVSWTYSAAAAVTQDDLSTYIAAEQVRDLLLATFHDFISMSIQHLIHEMGTRLLERFPQMRSVRFDAQNRLWDTAFSADDGATATPDSGASPHVYTDPRPPYGLIRLELTRD